MISESESTKGRKERSELTREGCGDEDGKFEI